MSTQVPSCPCATHLCTFRPSSDPDVWQTYEDIIAIIKSLPNVKGVRLEAKITLFGVEWAAAQDFQTAIGVVDRWKTKDTILMVKWEGWSQNKQCPLDSLDKDSDG